MKAILSTVLFVLFSFFLTAQDFEFYLQSDYCECVDLQVVGEEIDFFDVEFQITGSNGFFTTVYGNPTTYCDFFAEGQYTVLAIVSANGQIIWEDVQWFEIFYNYIEIFPISVCGVTSTTNTGGCATAYANELATYQVNGWVYDFDVSGGEIISQNGFEITVLWGDAGPGYISAYGDCNSYAELCVNIEPGPEASFTSTPAIVQNTIETCAGQDVYFENTSTNAVSFTWEPGTGESFSNTNLQYVYPNPGTYEVSLIAEGEYGCPDTSTVTVEVIEGIAPSIDCIGTVCAGEIVTYTSSDDCGVFDWVIGDNGVVTNGGASTDNFVTIEWIDGSIGLIELTVSSCVGDYCTKPAIVQVPIISPNSTITGDATVCNNTIKTYSLPNYTGVDFNWTVSNRGTIESGQGTNEITVSWSSGTVPLSNQSVSVIYDNCYLGCGGSATLPISILREYFASGPIEGCENGSNDFTANRSSGGTANAIVDWAVVAPDGSTIQTETGTANFTANWTAGSGNYQVVATSNNANNFCTDEYILNINILATPPTLTEIEGLDEICPGQPYSYKVTGEPNHTFQWNITMVLRPLNKMVQISQSLGIRVDLMNSPLLKPIRSVLIAFLILS